MKQYFLIPFLLLNIFQTTLAIAENTGQNYAGYKELEPSQTDCIIGNIDAKVTIVEYSSLSCPKCSDFHKNTYAQLKKQYIDTGKVRYVYRDFPTNPPALLGALLAHCSGSDRYYTYISTLMDSQPMWAYKNNFKEYLINIGKLGGISEDKINTCFTDKNMEKKILDKAMTGIKVLKINATPTFFINGNKYDGIMPFNDFAKIIEEKLK